MNHDRVGSIYYPNKLKIAQQHNTSSEECLSNSRQLQWSNNCATVARLRLHAKLNGYILFMTILFCLLLNCFVDCGAGYMNNELVSQRIGFIGGRTVNK